MGYNRGMRRATLEEREHLCRLDKKFGGDDLTSFIEKVDWACRRRKLSQSRMLGILFNAPGKTDLPEERLKAAARKLRRQGIESTPEQVGETMATVCHKIRNHMARFGWELPESDVALLKEITDLGVTFK